MLQKQRPAEGEETVEESQLNATTANRRGRGRSTWLVGLAGFVLGAAVAGGVTGFVAEAKLQEWAQHSAAIAEQRDTALHQRQQWEEKNIRSRALVESLTIQLDAAKEQLAQLTGAEQPAE